MWPLCSYNKHMSRTVSSDGAQLAHTHVLSHSGPIQEGAEKLGIWGRLRGRLGTLGSGTLGRLLVMVLPEIREWKSRKHWEEANNKTVHQMKSRINSGWLIILWHQKGRKQQLIDRLGEEIRLSWRRRHISFLKMWLRDTDIKSVQCRAVLRVMFSLESKRPKIYICFILILLNFLWNVFCWGQTDPLRVNMLVTFLKGS